MLMRFRALPGVCLGRCCGLGAYRGYLAVLFDPGGRADAYRKS